jgi:hypothetical protein
MVILGSKEVSNEKMGPQDIVNPEHILAGEGLIWTECRLPLLVFLRNRWMEIPHVT